MRKYLSLRNVSVAFLLSISLAVYQFNQDRSRHERLENKGIIVKGYSRFEMKETGYANFSFTTTWGEVIQHSQKCSENEFDKQYKTLFAIYNPDKPEEFEPLSDFAGYHKPWRNFFFLFLYPVFLTFFLILLYRNISLLIKYFRLKQSTGR